MNISRAMRQEIERETHRFSVLISGCGCECDPSVGIVDCVYHTATRHIEPLLVKIVELEAGINEEKRNGS